MRKAKRIPKCVRADEFPLLIKAVPSKDQIAKVSFLLAYGAGMRLAEVSRCDTKDFRSNSIFIPESKYGVERVVPIPKGWRDTFMKLLPLQVSTRTLQRKFVKYRDIANLPKYYTFHSLRHGFAIRLLENGAPINQVQVLMGHANISTTSIYTKANPTDAIKSYEDLF